MRAVRALALAGTVAWWSSGALAMPVAPERLLGIGAVRVQLVCAPDRCLRRPFWRYGRGVGFLPLRRFGPEPFRRFGPMPFRPFGPMPFRPFGFRRFGGFRR